VRAAAQRMGVLIDDLLSLSRITRREMRVLEVDLSALAGDVVARLREQEPHRSVEVAVSDGLTASGDAGLLEVLLVNLLGNAWKFTGGNEDAHIEFAETRLDDQRVFFVRDDGAGFDMAYVEKLFTPFERLHGPQEFSGTGIGLATVRRIVTRHAGRVWAEGAVGQGATFFFTLGAPAG
jgi:light-regulated signal transduction histidine kinase (bacteriophytochrome)